MYGVGIRYVDDFFSVEVEYIPVHLVINLLWKYVRKKLEAVFSFKILHIYVER